MDITTTTGFSWDNFKMEPLTYQTLPDYERTVRNWLELQPASMEPFYTKEDFLEKIRIGQFFGWLIKEGKTQLGIVLCSVRTYPQAQSIKIEFLSCQNFLTVAKLYSVVETIARKSGFDYIEAITHPTIAKYGYKHAGFSIPAVYVMKSLQHTRRN